MSVTIKTLIETKYASSSATTEYTAPTSTKTIIDKFTATNIGASTETMSVYLVPSGQSAGSAYQVVKDKSLSAGETYDLDVLKNHILSTGDFISVQVSTSSSVVIRASGREVT